MLRLLEELQVITRSRCGHGGRSLRGMEVSGDDTARDVSGGRPPHPCPAVTLSLPGGGLMGVMRIHGLRCEVLSDSLHLTLCLSEVCKSIESVSCPSHDKLLLLDGSWYFRKVQSRKSLSLEHSTVFCADWVFDSSPVSRTFMQKLECGYLFYFTTPNPLREAKTEMQAFASGEG